MPAVESRAPKRAAMVLGIAALAVLAAIGGSRTERRCGHRLTLIEQALARIGLGDRSHLEVEAALERWREWRTADDFLRILGHLPEGVDNERVQELLGRPDENHREPAHPLDSGVKSRICWIYKLGNINNGIVALNADGDSLAGFQVIVSRRILESCIAAGTLIAGEERDLPVERLEIGDRVWAFDLERRQRVLVRVTSITPAWADETVVIDGNLRATPEHPVHASGAWKPAGEVRPGDLLLAADGSERAARAPERRSGPVRVFDVAVEAPHCYFAGGLLVHNKTRAKAK